MNIQRVRTIKKYSLIIASAIFAVVPFVLARNNPAFRTVQGIAIYFLGIFNLLVIFWLLYLISEIGLFVQGKIGRALGLIIFGLLVFATKSAFICLGSLELPFFNEIGSFLNQPIVSSILRSVFLILLTIGVVDLARLYKK